MSKRVKYQDRINTKINKLFLLELIMDTSDKKHPKVKCKCDCGKEIIAYIDNVLRGLTTSCGCMHSENAKIQLEKACANNPLLNSKMNPDPRIGTAKQIFAHRYSDGNLTFEQFFKLSQENCFYCGIEPSNRSNHYLVKGSKYSNFRKENGYFIYNGLDRVNNNEPHNFENVVACCLPCNKAKLDRTKEEFFLWIKKIFIKHYGNIIK